ncbi:hypothetical protein CK203_045277 [Vitis vinifera]|uniref:CCHC-type domain-containing protein n=1 Tax=Vitis vinifera TaxID=29760 RepID=A0A438HID7_VITVI|nr:hypothetical protein CK203_045277 [Vitis vinifera]
MVSELHETYVTPPTMSTTTTPTITTNPAMASSFFINLNFTLSIKLERGMKPCPNEFINVAGDSFGLNQMTDVRVEYDPVFVIITTRPELFTLSEVCALLQNHETSIKQLNSCTQIVSKMSANFTVGGSSKDGRGCRNTHGNDRAHTRGHNSFHCSQYFGLGLGGYGRGNGLLPTCQVCGRQGHIAINCYHRFDRAFQSPPSNSLTFMVALPNTIADPSWYFDSGASTHVTNNPDNLSFKSYYNGHDKVTVGNDQVLPQSLQGILHFFAHVSSADNHTFSPVL